MTDSLPPYASALAAAYGPPSDGGFGSATFFQPGVTSAGLDDAALAAYRHFVGRGWDARPDAWMGAWRKVYTRPDGGRREIVSELGDLTDAEARRSVDLLLAVIENAVAARAALAGAMDAPSVEDLAVYTVGDGEAMSGLLVAGRRTGDDATFVIALMD